MEAESYLVALVVGPRDPNRHSKLPYFRRLHGSVFPLLILPLCFVAAWSSAITYINHHAPHSIGIDSLLLTVLGFVVGLSLSFRSSTGYERFSEGRKFWAQLSLTSRNFARLIWLHVGEREGEQGVDDLLHKITALNLVSAFAVALKHQLRFEPYADYDDLKDLVGHLDTYAKHARSIHASEPEKKTPFWKVAGEYLGLNFAIDNPRKELKSAKAPLGNLPLEILNYLSIYVDKLISDGQLKTTGVQNQALACLSTYTEILTGTERIVTTPLPLAYNIAISQITWLYVLVLPFQLVNKLKWNTIPGTIVAAYIILGIAAIGREVENPFGNDVNDLPLDSYCEQLAGELDIITSSSPDSMREFMTSSENLVLYPLSSKNYEQWKERSTDDIRRAIRTKVVQGFASKAAALQAKKNKRKGEKKGAAGSPGGLTATFKSEQLVTTQEVRPPT